MKTVIINKSLNYIESRDEGVGEGGRRGGLMPWEQSRDQQEEQRLLS